MKKNYYKIVFKLDEPLSVGSGDDKYSDHDIIKNSLGEPFIPGSTLAGVYRSALSTLTDSDLNQYFGWIETSGGDQRAHASELIVYDAQLSSDFYNIGIRDSVQLDEYRTSKAGSKFDIEYVEPGCEFTTFLEWNQDQKDDVCELIISAFASGLIVFGHKSMRGFGKASLVNVYHKQFDLGDQKQLNNWLNFDQYQQNAFGEIDRYIPKNLEKLQTEIVLELKQKSGISIRKYTTDLNNDGDSPDFTQMYYLDDKKMIPYIPGASWAGVFKHQMEKLMSPAEINEYFGYVKKDAKKSSIRFQESTIENAVHKVNVRNAIDRFTSGTIQGALYTEQYFYGGDTKLNIQINRPLSQSMIHALAATIADLHGGYMAIGGNSSIGRGLFEIQNIFLNGKKIELSQKTCDVIYKTVKQKLSESGE